MFRHLALTLDATNLMLLRHGCVGDDGVGDGAKAWKLSQKIFQRFCGDGDSDGLGGTARPTTARRFLRI